MSLYKPASDDPYPWSYYAKNEYLGEEVNVDMSAAIRALEELTGKQFIHRRTFEPKDMMADREEFANVMRAAQAAGEA